MSFIFIVFVHCSGVCSFVIHSVPNGIEIKVNETKCRS